MAKFARFVKLASLALIVSAIALPVAWAGDPLEMPQLTWPPKGEAAKFPVSRDNWLSAMGAENVGNNGKAPKLKLKGAQEFSIIDIDAGKLKGKLVTGALLHLRCESPAEPAMRVTVATVATPWVEGGATNYAKEDGASCFASPELGKRDWTFPGSNLLDATWGKGNTLWKFADATPLDKDGWQSVAVDADVVAARVANLSEGFALMDDVGSVWSQSGDKFTFTNFPNRFFASKESPSAPWLEIWTSGEDNQAPAAVADLTADAANLPPGQAVVRWKTPADAGGGKTLGFNVTYKAGEAEKPVPRYLIPMAKAAGQEVVMWLKNLPLAPGQSVELAISPVDSAGNVGPAFKKTIKVSDHPQALKIEPTGLKPFPPSEKLPEVAGLKVAVVDILDKIEGKTGKMVPAQPAGYKGGNHLWSGEQKLVRLQAARNETVGFQLNLAGKAEAVEVKLTMDDAALAASVGRMDYVTAKNGAMPDVVVPLTKPLSIPGKDDPEAAGQTNASLVCEVYVPHEAKPGLQKGTLLIQVGEDKLAIPVELTVWEFTLPNKLSFVPEMNAYGTAMPTGAGLNYYRVAHEHRTCLNRLYYTWSGAVQLAPAYKGGGKFDWANYDKEVAGLLDGSAFKDLPRKGEPVDIFYLPFNENWPLDIYANYTKSYWPEEALSAKYRDELRSAFADFAGHFNQKGWHDTIFEFYLNNKVYYKEQGWKVSAAPWIFDEPANTQDWWALRWYGILFHQGVDPVRGKAKFWYRSDISRSNYDRDMMWNVLDMEVLGGMNTQKARQKLDEQVMAPAPSYWEEYGGANDPGDANTQAAVWCLLSWSRGGTGVLPWQTIGTQAAWGKAESTALFYAQGDKVLPSVRLKAFTRGQQDVEYLTLLGDVSKQPLWAVANGMSGLINLTGKVVKTSAEDAGIIQFDKADPTALWTLRVSVAAMVSAKKPAYKRVVRPMETIPYDMKNLPDIGYVRTAPKVESAKPQ